MAHIVNSGVRTKRQLRELLKTAPYSVSFEDPSIFPGAWSGAAPEMKVGQTLTCTNHPKRSWYATITKTKDGFKVS